MTFSYLLVTLGEEKRIDVSDFRRHRLKSTPGFPGLNPKGFAVRNDISRRIHPMAVVCADSV